LFGVGGWNETSSSSKVYLWSRNVELLAGHSELLGNINLISNIDAHSVSLIKYVSLISNIIGNQFKLDSIGLRHLAHRHLPSCFLRRVAIQNIDLRVEIVDNLLALAEEIVVLLHISNQFSHSIDPRQVRWIEHDDDVSPAVIVEVHGFV